MAEPVNPQNATPVPPNEIAPTPKAAPIAAKAPGGFAAKIKAMMDGARADLAQTQADALAQVGDAVGELNQAKVQTAAVAASMVKTIKDETAAALAELGQISNFPPE